MSLKALDSIKNKYILAFWFNESLEIRAKHPSLVCPCCGGKMFARGGLSKKVTTHFAHCSDRQNCLLGDRYKTRTELLHHTMAVRSAYDYLLPTLPEGFTLDLEHRSDDVPERIADIAVINPAGAMEQAHEIQLTKVTVEELEERTLSYENAGVECIWWFGKGCESEDIKLWAMRNAGYYQLIELNYFENVDKSTPSDFFAHTTAREPLLV